MAFAVNHVHLKTPDPAATAKFYVENFGATIKEDAGPRGLRLDLHGLQLNISTIIATQNHEQHLGIEHIALNTDDFTGTLAKLKAAGVTILEEMRGGAGQRICFVQCPDGAQMEVIEKT
jgi:predicted enzyme related to lactoylglutathione lyase